MYKKIIVFLLFVITASLLSAELVYIPEIYEGQNFKLTVMHSEKIAAGTMFFRPAGTKTYSKINLSLFGKQAEVNIPYSVLPAGSYDFYVNIRDIKNNNIRMPEADAYFSVKEDNIAPKINILQPLPKEKFFTGENVKIIVYIEETGVGVEKDGIVLKVNDKQINDFTYVSGILQYTAAYSETGNYGISLEVKDRKGNVSKTSSAYRVAEKGKSLFEFVFDPSYKLNGSVSYSKSTDVSTPVFDDFKNGESEFLFSHEIGLNTYAKFLFVKLGMQTKISEESTKVQNIFLSLPESLKLDVKDFERLFMPVLTFDPEKIFTGINDFNDYRRTETLSNYHNVFLDTGILAYTFGDKEINFSDNTVKNAKLRGHTLSADLYLLNAEIAAGNTSLGQYGAKYPQFFFGGKVGAKLPFDIIKLDADVSYVTDFQGDYPEWNLRESWNIPSSVKPQENILLGTQLSANLGIIKAKVFANADVYLSDVSDPVDIPTLLDNYGLSDLATTVNNLVPKYLFDYVAVSMNSLPSLEVLGKSGLLALVQSMTGSSTDTAFDISKVDANEVSNLGLWGLFIGANAEVPILNLNLKYYKADRSYKSMLASAPSDELFYGADGNWNISGINIKGSYSHTHKYIPDILFSDILPIVTGGNIDFVKTFISPQATAGTKITDQYFAEAGFKMPLGLGRIKANYTMKVTKSDFTSESSFTVKNENAVKAALTGLGFKAGSFALSSDYNGGINFVNLDAAKYLEYSYGNKTVFNIFKSQLYGIFSDKYTGQPDVDQILARELEGGLKLSLFGPALKVSVNYKTKSDAGIQWMQAPKNSTESKAKAYLTGNLWNISFSLGGTYSRKDLSPQTTDKKTTSFEAEAKFEFSF